MQFALWCAEHGLAVSVPLGDRHRYDMVVDTGKRLLRVQVKTAWRDNGKTFTVSFVNLTTEHGKVVHRSYRGQVDVLVGYNALQKRFYLFGPGILAQLKRDIVLRYQPSVNNQTKGIRLASDYELTDVTQLDAT
jgi:hypothetical protein